eukprot:4117629-Alexandrium_andersonii.AAC.1
MEASRACAVLLGTLSDDDVACLRRWASLNCRSFHLEAGQDSAYLLVVRPSSQRLPAHKNALRKALKGLGIKPPSVKGWVRLLSEEQALAAAGAAETHDTRT